ncbi:hypothetical protein ACVWWW_001556 [Lysobacter sp. HA18]
MPSISKNVWWARGIADLVEIVVLAAGAQAALHVGSAHVAGLLAAEEHVLELHHARVGEQQRGVVGRNQRRRRNDGVSLAAEEFDEIATDFGRGFHTGAVRLDAVQPDGRRKAASRHWEDLEE